MGMPKIAQVRAYTVAAKELIDGFLPDLAEQVIEGEVNSTDGVEDDPLAAVEEGREVHLVPDALNIGYQRALEEPR